MKRNSTKYKIKNRDFNLLLQLIEVLFRTSFNKPKITSHRQKLEPSAS